MVRFINGQPDSIYLSAHSSGSAYKYSALQSSNGRAVTYIAEGSHANYATSGQHQHDIPLLFDYTNDGLTWDMTKNFRGFWFDTASNTFTAAVGAGVGASVQAVEGLSWLSFSGRWGDQEYPLFIKNGQYCILEHECKYVSGPTGMCAIEFFEDCRLNPLQQVPSTRILDVPSSARRRLTALSTRAFNLSVISSWNSHSLNHHSLHQVCCCYTIVSRMPKNSRRIDNPMFSEST